MGRIIALFSVFISLAGRAATPPPELNINLDTEWKKQVYNMAAELKHTAWGLEHFERDYLVSEKLARAEKMTIDEDVMFAAAMLHDMGGFPKYAKEGVDHAVRGAEIVGDYLKPMGFPVGKIPAVAKAILTHSYYSDLKPETPEAIVLHDADALDFLGDMSVARILSITERESAAPDLAGAFKLLQSLLKQAPKSLVTKTATELAKPRIDEMKNFLATTSEESFDGKAL